MSLTALVDELETYISSYQVENLAVSKSTVGWQVAHALKVMKGIVYSMEASDPTAYKGKFSLGKVVILATKIIPRGAARAPKMVLPKEEELTPEFLTQQLQSVRATLAKAAMLPANAYFEHPMFGGMKKKTALRFIEIHSLHHVKIIRDILKKR